MTINIRGEGFTKKKKAVISTEAANKGTPEKIAETENTGYNPQNDKSLIVKNESFISEFIYWVIILTLVFLLLIFVIKSMVPKESVNTEKYEQFYNDIATVLDINITGKSIDDTTEEMIMKVVELHELEEPSESENTLTENIQAEAENEDEKEEKNKKEINSEENTKAQRRFTNNFDFLNED